MHTTINEELNAARCNSPSWFADFDDSRLHVPGAADFAECAAIAERAPTPNLHRYVLGLLANNPARPDMSAAGLREAN